MPVICCFRPTEKAHGMFKAFALHSPIPPKEQCERRKSSTDSSQSVPLNELCSRFMCAQVQNVLALTRCSHFSHGLYLSLPVQGRVHENILNEKHTEQPSMMCPCIFVYISMIILCESRTDTARLNSHHLLATNRGVINSHVPG